MLVNLAQDQVDSFITSIQLKHALKLFESNNGAICDSKAYNREGPIQILRSYWSKKKFDQGLKQI